MHGTSKPTDGPLDFCWDESFIALFTAMQCDLLGSLAERGLGFIWVMHGQRRLIPAHVVADLWRVVQDRIFLHDLGRDSELRPAGDLGFWWGQTIPLPPVGQGSQDGGQQGQ